MCGIYGTTIRYNQETIEKKLQLMRFRGPDNMASLRLDTGDGTQITLGHVRLSIVDLDPRSNQPFRYNENISIVFNGEIYNYKELRKQYLPDVRFRTGSDTEVICAMYERFGKDCVKYFNGMFAYVIFDRARNVFVGARDRLGKKPFYYRHEKQGTFEFASQVKCIAYGNKMEVDETARALYLLHGWIPDPYCIYKGIRKLRAGEHFTYHLDTNELEIDKYWDIHTNSCGFTAPKSYDEAKGQIKELLFDAVKLRLDADVPVGTFLSGGIDSSLVCAIASQYNKDICAYSIGFDNPQNDESCFAIEVAKALGIPLKVNICHGEDQDKIFDDYINYYDEPFCDPSMIPSSLVAQKAKEDVTVALGGDGGDELFFGYEKYLYILPRLAQYKKPYWLRKLASPYFLLTKGYKDMVYATQHEYSDVYRSEGIFVYDFGGSEKFDRIALSKVLPDKDLFLEGRGILAYTDYDMKFFLNAMNQKVDRASMRSSLELRTPLMDYRLAEYSRLLPFDYLYGKYGLKTILKDILYDIVPRELLDRPKQGFMPPTADWFETSLKGALSDVVTKENVQSLLPELHADKFIKLRDEFMGGKKMDARRFWAVYTYINWYNIYMTAK